MLTERYLPEVEALEDLLKIDSRNGKSPARCPAKRRRPPPGAAEVKSGAELPPPTAAPTHSGRVISNDRPGETQAISGLLPPTNCRRLPIS